MLDIQNYISFIAAILVFQAVPGAGTIAILDATARDGRRSGLAAVLGTLLGDFLFMVAAVAGLAAVMQAHPWLFRGLQWFGVAYLGWLAVQLMHFRRAFLVSLTNPKVILFFVAFFPLFLKPQASTATLVVMMVHVTLLSLLYQAALVLIGNVVAVRFAAVPGGRRTATRLAGLVLIALAIRLALDMT
jgi:leucine efflux protein